MATPKVRAACRATVAQLAPELPLVLELGPRALNDASTSNGVSINGAGGLTHSGAGWRVNGAGPPSSTTGNAVLSENGRGRGSTGEEANGGSGEGSGDRRAGGEGPEIRGRRARLELKTSSDLTQAEKEALFALWKANMGHYTQLEYTDKGKWEEMYDPDARYLVIRSESPSRSTSPEQEGRNGPGSDVGASGGRMEEEGGRKRRRTEKSEEDNDGELLGFASFRFDTEETMSSQDAEVIYWYVFLPLIRNADISYELQLAPNARRQGLAKRLMDTLESIGRRRGMAKSMLTCLVGESPSFPHGRDGCEGGQGVAAVWRGSGAQLTRQPTRPP